MNFFTSAFRLETFPLFLRVLFLACLKALAALFMTGIVVILSIFSSKSKFFSISDYGCPIRNRKTSVLHLYGYLKI